MQVSSFQNTNMYENFMLRMRRASRKGLNHRANYFHNYFAWWLSPSSHQNKRTKHKEDVPCNVHRIQDTSNFERKTIETLALACSTGYLTLSIKRQISHSPHYQESQKKTNSPFCGRRGELQLVFSKLSKVSSC